MNPNALLAWLEQGSNEDWSNEVGRLATPALVCAGSEDKALGPEAQRTHTITHFENATLATMQGGGHLAPLERPAELIELMLEFFNKIGVPASAHTAVLGPAVSQLIASEQTSPATRQALLSRLSAPDVAGTFTPEELRTLRALIATVVPDTGFDLALRLDQSMSEAKHDGWRFDTLPPDGQAWKRGLLSLDLAAIRELGVPFVALDQGRQKELLTRAQKGDLGRGLLGALHLGESENAFRADQMRNWFEDVRGEVAKLYVSDPRTMERIGFTGFADERGFTQITLQDREESAF
jgi:hypothetical protein